MESDPLEDHSYLHFSEEFDSSIEFPFFDPPFIEEMHTLTGTTHAENMRHIIARIELLNCFSEDPIGVRSDHHVGPSYWTHPGCRSTRTPP